MNGKVLATPEAHSAINALGSLINGDLTTQIASLDRQGQILSDPNVWDGPLAMTFRSSTWPETHAALNKAKQELMDLKTELDKIRQNIMTAGGA